MNRALRTAASAASPIVSALLERAHARRGGVILAYHEMSEARLREQLGAVAERYRYVPLSEFVDRLARGQSTVGLAAITYDDGYGPTIEAAAALALEHGWPMTFYLPTRYLDSRQPFWYQELGALLERSSRRSGTLGGIAFELGSPAATAAANAALNRFFRSLQSEPEVERQLRELRRLLHGSEERPAWLETTAPIGWERVRELARHDALSFDAHTVNHLALARLDDDAIGAEMERSRERIEAFTGRRVEHFCYPYGGRDEISAAACEQARRRFRSSVTLLRGRCAAGADRAFLPRVPLYEGDSRSIAALKVATAR